MAENQTTVDPFAEFSAESLVAKQPDPFAEFSEELVTAEVDEFEEFSAEPSVEAKAFAEQQAKGEAIERRRNMRDATIRKENISGIKNLLKAPVIGAIRGSVEIEESIADFIPMPSAWEEGIRDDVANVRSRLPTPEEQGFTAGMVSTLAQFGIPFAAMVGKVGTTGGMVKRLASSAALGAAVDLAVFDEHEARLSDYLTKLDNPVLNNAVSQFMVARDDDPAVMGKIRQLVEGATIGLTADAFITMLQAVKGGKILQRFKGLGFKKPLDPLSDEALVGLESAVGQKFGLEQMDIEKLEAVPGFQTGTRIEAISQIADDIQTGGRVPSILVEVDTDGNPVRLLSGADDIKASQMLSARFDGTLTKLKVKTLPVDSLGAMKVNAALVDQANTQSRKAKADLHENFRTRMGRWASAEKWVDASSDIKGALLKSGGYEGKVAVMMHDLAAGATPKAAHAFQTYARDIYTGLDSVGERTLDDIINSRRIIEIDNYKGAGKIRHSGGLTGREHGDKLKSLEIEMGPEAWSDMQRRADRYFDAMKQQLGELRENKIIDEKLFEKLKNFDYRPIRYLDLIDPIRSVDIGGRKISVRDSGIALLDRGKDQPIELSSRELLTQVVGRTQNRVARNNANLALRDVGLQYPDNGVVKVPKAIVEKSEVKATTETVMTPGEKISQDEALHRYFDRSVVAKENDMTFDEWLDGIGGAQGSEARVFISIEQQKALEPTQKIIKSSVKKVPKVKTPKGFSRVSVIVDGEPQPLFIETKLAGQWITQNPQLTREWAEALRWASGSPIVRALATGHNPGFAFTNFPRDLMHIYMTTQEYSRHAPIAMGQISRDLASTFMDAVRKKGAYVDYINEGGGMNFLTHQGRDVFINQPDSVRQQLDPKFARLKEVTGYIGETSELWTRLMLRQRAMRNGKSNLDATWTARNYMDFAQGGSWAKAADHQIPYLNATIQALRGAMRSAKDDPKGFWTKVGWMQATAGGLTIANWMNHPEAMLALPDKECQDYWCFPTGGKTVDKQGNTRHHYFRIKKDDSMKPLLWPVDASMTWFFKGRAPDEGAFETLTQTIPLMKGNLPIPTIAAYATYASNHDFWFSDEIWKGKTLPWPLSAGEFKVEGQGRPTPKEWVAFGEATGLSPERGRAAFRQVIPRNPFLDLAVGGGQLGARMLGGERLITEQEGDKTLDEMLNSMPLVRRFSHLTHPAETELIRTEKIVDPARAKRLEVNRQYATQYNEFRRGRQSLGDVQKWIGSQPEEFRSALEKQHDRGVQIDIAFSRMHGVEGIPSSISWLQWMNQPVDVRAELFYKEYIGKDPVKRKKMLTMGQSIPGFWTDDFHRFFGRILNRQGREQH